MCVCHSFILCAQLGQSLSSAGCDKWHQHGELDCPHWSSEGTLPWEVIKWRWGEHILYSAHQVWTPGQAESRASCLYWCFGTDFGGLRGGVWALQLHWVLDCSGDILLVSRRRGRGVWLLGEDWIDAWPSDPNVFLFLFLFCSILFVTL